MIQRKIKNQSSELILNSKDYDDYDDSFEEVRQQELDSKIYQNRVLLATSCTLPLDAPKNKGK